MKREMAEPGRVIPTSSPVESELFIERGGPGYRLMQRVGLIKGDGLSIGRRILGFLLITWFPLLVLSIIDGRAIGPTPRESFLLDFATYARFFVAVPALIIADLTVGARLKKAGLHFQKAGLIQPEDLPQYDAAVSKLARRRESSWAELIILIFSISGSWIVTAELFVWRNAVHNWQFVFGAGESHISLSGLWYKLIAIPLLQFLLYRWFWRLVIWGSFLCNLSRLKLRLIPIHPDRAAGLGFLGEAHCSLDIFAFGFSSVLVAEVAFRVFYEGGDLPFYLPVLAVFLVIAELLVFGVLLIFVPQIIQAKRDWMLRYSALSNRHNRAFNDKWVEDKNDSSQAPLGSQDPSSLIDLGSSFQMLQATRAIPFGRTQLISVALIASIPVLPLVLLVVPLTEILKFIFRSVL